MVWFGRVGAELAEELLAGAVEAGLGSNWQSATADRAWSGYLARPLDDPAAEDGVPGLDPSFGYMPAVLGVRLDRDHQQAHVGVGARVDDDLHLPEVCLDHVQADPVPAGEVGRGPVEAHARQARQDGVQFGLEASRQRIIF